MAKTLGQRKKYLPRNPAKYMRLVARPRFVCAGCGRAARKKKHLCRAIAILEASCE
ncbi:MAG: hypothetical protein NZM11_07825 [Anaerolineales bacterium]|nr:hypothetical protein [Anaerolineales bacterium]MDW8327151.1 hypothetical protein [Anaerolineales bacterium]